MNNRLINTTKYYYICHLFRIIDLILWRHEMSFLFLDMCKLYEKFVMYIGSVLMQCVRLSYRSSLRMVSVYLHRRHFSCTNLYRTVDSDSSFSVWIHLHSQIQSLESSDTDGYIVT